MFITNENCNFINPVNRIKEKTYCQLRLGLWKQKDTL